MNFKVGDRARVRADLKENERYGGLTLYAPYMSRFRGKEFIISSVCEDDNTYEFAGNIYTWSGEMLEPAWPGWTLIVRPDKADPDKTIAILKVGGKETRHESVKRYYKDEYNSGAAIREVVAKLLDPNGCAVAEGTLKPASDAIKAVELKAEASEKADEPVIGPPATVEPPKPEPVMIGGRKLKVGSKFILKPYGEVVNHHGVSESDWGDEFGKILVVSKVYASATPPYIDAENGCCFYCYDAIDRILED